MKRLYIILSLMIMPNFLVGAADAPHEMHNIPLLHETALSGNIQAVQELLDLGADPNLQDNKYGLTPMMYIVSHLEANNKTADLLTILKLLIDHNADLFLKNKHGEDVLMIASDLDPALKQKVLNILARAFNTETMITIPAQIAQKTGIKQVPFNINDVEGITLESFKEIIDNLRSVRFEIIFTQDANNNWHTMILQSASLLSIPNQNPFNRQVIKYRLPFVVTPYQDKYRIATIN